MTEAFIFDAVRTPRGKGKSRGALHEVRPIDLLKAVLDAIRQRNHLDTSSVDDAIIGCVTPVNDQGGNIAKTALLYAGWDNSVGGMQINRFCSSGLDAVNLAAARIRSGWDDLIIAGGVESMSRVPMASDEGPLLYDPEVITKIGYIPQGVSADLIATLEGFSREEIDAFALSSQQKAVFAQNNGHFDKSIIPILDINDILILNKDEIPRAETNLQGLAALSPSFSTIGAAGFDTMAIWKYPIVEKIKHLHTAGNSSGLADGAALALIGNKKEGNALHLKPRAKILSVASVSTEPTIMLTGVTPAIKKALQKVGLNPNDIDLWEINEAFGAVVLKVQRDLNIPFDKINVNGGAIALGHPLGATGTMLIGMLLDELERRNLQLGVVALCVGGGMGVATVIERV